MTELVPANRQEVRFPAFSVLLVHGHGFSRRMLTAWSVVAASVRASDDYGDQPRIVRRATVDRSASIAARQKTQQRRSDCCSGVNDRFWRAPWQGGAFQWVQVPPGERSSRK